MGNVMDGFIGIKICFETNLHHQSQSVTVYSNLTK